jgi:hypothetical protein
MKTDGQEMPQVNLNKRLTGVHLSIFNEMVEVVSEDWPTRGRRRTLSPVEAVRATLIYYRQYPTMALLGSMAGVSEATICRIIKRVEDALVKSGRFRVQGKKLYFKPGDESDWSLLTQASSRSTVRVAIKRISIAESINGTE